MERHTLPIDMDTGSRTGAGQASRTLASGATMSREPASGLRLQSVLLDQLDEGHTAPWNLPQLGANMLLYHTQRLPQPRFQNTYTLLARQGHARAADGSWERQRRLGPRAKKTREPSYLKDRSKVRDVLSSKQYLYETQRDSGGSDEQQNAFASAATSTVQQPSALFKNSFVRSIQNVAAAADGAAGVDKNMPFTPKLAPIQRMSPPPVSQLRSKTPIMTVVAPSQQNAALFSDKKAKIDDQNGQQVTPAVDSNTYTPASTILISHSQVPSSGLPLLVLSDPSAFASLALDDRDAADEEVIKQIIRQRWKSNTTARLKPAAKGKPRHQLSPVQEPEALLSSERRAQNSRDERSQGRVAGRHDQVDESTDSPLKGDGGRGSGEMLEVPRLPKVKPALSVSGQSKGLTTRPVRTLADSSSKGKQPSTEEVTPAQSSDAQITPDGEAVAEATIITPEPDRQDQKLEPTAATKPSARKKVLRDHSGSQSFDGVELCAVAGQIGGSEQTSEAGKVQVAKRRQKTTGIKFHTEMENELRTIPESRKTAEDRTADASRQASHRDGSTLDDELSQAYSRMQAINDRTGSPAAQRAQPEPRQQSRKKGSPLADAEKQARNFKLMEQLHRQESARMKQVGSKRPSQSPRGTSAEERLTSGHGGGSPSRVQGPSASTSVSVAAQEVDLLMQATKAGRHETRPLKQKLFFAQLPQLPGPRAIWQPPVSKPSTEADEVQRQYYNLQRKKAMVAMARVRRRQVKGAQGGRGARKSGRNRDGSSGPERDREPGSGRVETERMRGDRTRIGDRINVPSDIGAASDRGEGELSRGHSRDTKSRQSETSSENKRRLVGSLVASKRRTKPLAGEGKASSKGSAVSNQEDGLQKHQLRAPVVQSGRATNPRAQASPVSFIDSRWESHQHVTYGPWRKQGPSPPSSRIHNKQNSNDDLLQIGVAPEASPLGSTRQHKAIKSPSITFQSRSKPHISRAFPVLSTEKGPLGAASGRAAAAPASPRAFFNSQDLLQRTFESKQPTPGLAGVLPFEHAQMSAVPLTTMQAGRRGALDEPVADQGRKTTKRQVILMNQSAVQRKVWLEHEKLGARTSKTLGQEDLVEREELPRADSPPGSLHSLPNERDHDSAMQHYTCPAGPDARESATSPFVHLQSLLTSGQPLLLPSPRQVQNAKSGRARPPALMPSARDQKFHRYAQGARQSREIVDALICQEGLTEAEAHQEAQRALLIYVENGPEKVQPILPQEQPGIIRFTHLAVPPANYAINLKTRWHESAKRDHKGQGELTTDKTSHGLSFISKTENTKEKSYIFEEEQDAPQEEQEQQQFAVAGQDDTLHPPHLLSHRQMIKILKQEKTRQANLVKQHEWKLKTFIDPTRKLQTGLKARLGHEIQALEEKFEQQQKELVAGKVQPSHSKEENDADGSGTHLPNYLQQLLPQKLRTLQSDKSEGTAEHVLLQRHLQSSFLSPSTPLASATSSIFGNAAPAYAAGRTVQPKKNLHLFHHGRQTLEPNRAKERLVLGIGRDLGDKNEKGGSSAAQASSVPGSYLARKRERKSVGGFCYREQGERTMKAKDLRTQRAYLEEVVAVVARQTRDKFVSPSSSASPGSTGRRTKKPVNVNRAVWNRTAAPQQPIDHLAPDLSLMVASKQIVLRDAIPAGILKHPRISQSTQADDLAAVRLQYLGDSQQEQASSQASSMQKVFNSTYQEHARAGPGVGFVSSPATASGTAEASGAGFVSDRARAGSGAIAPRPGGPSKAAGLNQGTLMFILDATNSSHYRPSLLPTPSLTTSPPPIISPQTESPPLRKNAATITDHPTPEAEAARASEQSV